MKSISLVILDTLYYEDANFAIENSLKNFNFDEVLIFSDDESKWNGRPIVKIPKMQSIIDYSYLCIKEVPKYINTDYYLNIQHDGFVINGDCWQDKFFEYDYIGAPWLDGNVGNGGFSLRSKKLANTVINSDFYVGDTRSEDGYMCYTIRKELEEQGIKFAPKDVAEHFSWESYAVPFPTFGFHNHGMKMQVREILGDNFSVGKPIDFKL